MTIQVYPYNEQEEKALLDFLTSRHYNYKSTEENELPDAEFLNQYNKEMDEAEAQIDAGDYLTHDEVKKFFADKKKPTLEKEIQEDDAFVLTDEQLQILEKEREMHLSGKSKSYSPEEANQIIKGQLSF